MRQTVFLLFLAMGLASFIGVNYYLNHQVELKAKSAAELAAFQSDQDVERMKFLGEYLLNLKSPDFVTAYKVESDWPNYPEKPVKYRYPTSARLMDRFPVIRGRFIEDLGLKETLTSNLLTKTNFTNVTRPCGYMHPDVAFEFEKDGKSLVVAVSMDCRQVEFIRDDGKTFAQLFDPVFEELKPVIKSSLGVLVH